MNDQQLLRYSRHILLDEMGEARQQLLLDAHALVVGAGGLGCPAALYLASAGVGRITLVDDDTVELSNLQRQIAHASSTLGASKVQSLAESIHRINPDTVVHALHQRASDADLMHWVGDVDVVLDCSDNFATRHAINRACVCHKTPLVSGAAIQFDAQISVYDARVPKGPCYACIFPQDQHLQEARCATMGVFAPLTGIVGATQAAEAIKLLAGLGQSLAGRLLMLDASTMRWHEMQLARDPQCLVCGDR